MPKPRTNRSLKAKRNVEPWSLHGTYNLGVGFSRIVTRSQTAFSRLKNDESDLKFFCDPLMHQLPGKQHILEVLKGKYGSIPRTIITRSTLQHLKVTKSLCKRVDEYKDENLRTELLKEYLAEQRTNTPSHKALVKKSTKDAVRNPTTLGDILNEIYEKDVELESNHHVKRKLVEEFLEVFQSYCINHCPVFSKLFKGFYLTGSYFEDLRVCHATEFDINIVLSFSSIDLQYEVKELGDLPFLIFQAEKTSLNELEDCFKSLFQGRYLIPKKVHSWFQSNVAKFCTYCKNTSKFKNLGISKVDKSENGPACTLNLCTFSKATQGNVGTLQYEYISIDLVPVFEISVDRLHKYTYENVHFLSKDDGQYCHLVPKPLRHELNFLKPDRASKAWRVSFPKPEKHIFTDKVMLKKIIKLMKVLRDNEKWNIPSYYLKVVAFWLVNKRPEPTYWHQSDLGDLFLEYVQEFGNNLSSNHLGQIIYPKFNLLENLTPNTVQLILKRIKNIEEKLRRDPQYAYNYFKTYKFL